MTTEHTADAVAAYSRINTALCTLRVMLEQENVQHARRPDVTTLECVAVSLEAVEDRWATARFIADADRQLEDAADERETERDALDVGVQ
jgi:hypothetical protein